MKADTSRCLNPRTYMPLIGKTKHHADLKHQEISGLHNKISLEMAKVKVNSTNLFD